MHSYLPAAFAVVALLGLAIVQYQLLHSGIQLERQRFEQKVYAALQEVEQEANHRSNLRRQARRLRLQDSQPLAMPEQMLPQRVTDTLAAILTESLAHQGLHFPLHFSLVEDFLGHAIAGEPFQGAARGKQWATYSHRMRGLIQQECGCNLVLHLQVEQLFGLLRKRLNYLLLPSIGFLLILLASLFYLARTLNRQRQLARVRNDLINNLAHELKTPTFSISLLSKLLRQSIETGQPEKSGAYLNLIERENGHTKGHIEKVLELASLENGRYQLALREGRLHLALESIVPQYRLRIGEQNGSLDCRLEASEDAVLMDEAHLCNAVRNLLDNAVKYSGGSPVIGICTENRGHAILVSVTDQGPGIAPEHQKKVFSKFYRAPGNSAVKGFGLGLNYVAVIARAHHGKVSLESSPGKGSRFILEIPLAGRNRGQTT
ncbi:MAG: HAMP domain-containing histidine kinase [Phaeodactylibacter sp.]|nr:HAMP domain-containing histidine kinase [Phaeodactylibacter sp.]MCB9274580.1 HAMP domain-containing histidine kinase [Lewinellaceae bacterium]